MKLSHIALHLGCACSNTDGLQEIIGIAAPETALALEIVFLSDPKYLPAVTESPALVVIVKTGTAIAGKILLEVADPYVGYAKVAQLFEDCKPLFAPHTPQTVYIDPSASVHASVALGPFCVIGARCSVGENTVLGAGVVVEPGCTLGSNCRIDSRAVIKRYCSLGNNVIIESGTVIGSEGFGNAYDGKEFVRIPSMGTVIIEDNVWIGANTCIDRGALGPTVIGKGSRLDNLIHIAHNVTVGHNTAMAAQVGISGSTKVGNNVILAGQAGFVGHIEIGDGAFVGAQAGVSKSVAPGAKVTGYPARDFMTMRRIEAAESELPQLIKEFRHVKKRLDKLDPPSV